MVQFFRIDSLKTDNLWISLKSTDCLHEKNRKLISIVDKYVDQMLNIYLMICLEESIDELFLFLNLRVCFLRSLVLFNRLAWKYSCLDRFCDLSIGIEFFKFFRYIGLRHGQVKSFFDLNQVKSSQTWLDLT